MKSYHIISDTYVRNISLIGDVTAEILDYCQVYIHVQLHGSKVSRESDLRSVPYNRPVGVRSFMKNVKSLSKNQHNS